MIAPAEHSTIPTEWLPRAVDDAHEAVFGGELVVFVEPTSQVHRVTGLAAAAWLLCDGDTPIPSMVDELADTLGADTATITRELPGALISLRDAGLLAAADGGATAASDELADHHHDAGIIWPISDP